MMNNPSTATRLRDIQGSKPSTLIPPREPESSFCPICNKPFTQGTLVAFGGTCGPCSKSKGRCKICDVEKTINEMWSVDSTSQGPLCRTCYIPTALSYSIYVLLFIYLLVQNIFIFFIGITLFFILFLFLESPEFDMFGKLKNAHNYAIGPNNVHRSSMVIVFLAIILCIILAWTLASPWFVYTVTYEHSYLQNADSKGEAFTHEYYLGYVQIDIDNSENVWRNSYLNLNEEYNYPWYYNFTHNSFWINYGEYGDSDDDNNVADFKHRDYVSSVTLGLGIVSLAGYVLSIITGFIFYRMTAKLEPNFLYLKNREKFQSQVNSFARKLANMKKKGVVVSSLNPYLNELKKMAAFSQYSPINVNNPLKTLNLMILFMVVGVSFSASAVLFYSQNWYDAVLDDGVGGIWQDRSGWTATAGLINFVGNYYISPMLTVLSLSIAVGLILTASHVIFLHRSCYNMITEISDSSSRTSDFKIPSELLNDTEEPLSIEEEESLATPELPDPGEGMLLAEVEEAEPESGKDET